MPYPQAPHPGHAPSALAQPPHVGPAPSPYPQAPQARQGAPTPLPGPYGQQPEQRAQAHPTPPPHARQPTPPYHRPGPHQVPDPTVILMRQRRPRGLVITMSVLVTMGLVIGGILALTRLKDDASAGAQPVASTGTEIALAQATQPAADPTADPAPDPTADPAPGTTAGTTPGTTPEPAAGPTAATGNGAPDPANPEAAAATPEAAPDAPGKQPAISGTAGTLSGDPAPGRAEPAATGRSPALATQTDRGSGRSTGRSDVTLRQPEPAWVALTIQPDTAAVTVDGDTYRGPALQRMGPLEPGTHTLRITAPGHESVERTVELSAGETERVSLSLAPTARGPGKVRVRSTPASATVLVDGKVRGITPVTLELDASKTYELTLSQDGYETWRTLIEPAAGKQLEVETTLSREPGAAPIAADPGKKERDISVPASMVGNASRGRALYERCRSCHGSKSTITPRSQTQSGWTRFLASRRHARHAELRPVFSVSELADVKAFLLENAADVDHGMAAGVR